MKKVSDTIFFTFGRFNPPTLGHGQLLKFLQEKSKSAVYRVYVSQNHDDKNPLKYEFKIKILRRMFPSYGRNIYHDKGINGINDIAVALYKEGYKNIVMVCGRNDEIELYKKILTTYNGLKNHYSFNSINVISTGIKENGYFISPEKLKELVKENNYGEFLQYIPRTTNKNVSKELFKIIKKGMPVKKAKMRSRFIKNMNNINTNKNTKENIHEL